MNRRRVLLVVAALIAALGTLLVFLYVRGADQRAGAAYQNVQVLKVVEPIGVGESIDAAAAAGKIQKSPVPAAQVVGGALDTIQPIAGQVALMPILAGEQVVSTKFGDTGAADTGLNIPDDKVAISLNLSDTGRVAGFVNPGAKVAIFLNGSDPDSGQTYSRLLMTDVEVIAVGTTTLVSQTVTDPTGAATTEQLPRTLFTLALDQASAEKILYAQTSGELNFALLTEDSTIAPTKGVNQKNLFG